MARPKFEISSTQVLRTIFRPYIDLAQHILHSAEGTRRGKATGKKTRTDKAFGARGAVEVRDEAIIIASLRMGKSVTRMLKASDSAIGLKRYL